MDLTHLLTIALSFLAVSGTTRLWAVPPAIAAGRDHSVFLGSDGLAWVAGFYATTTGRLVKGDGGTPVQVLDGVQAVSAGVAHTLFLKNDGSVWSEGSNRSGELGDGTRINRATPVRVMDGVRAISAGGFHSFYVKSDNSLWASGRNFDGQLADGTRTDRVNPVKVMENIATASGGWFISLFLKTDGTVLAMGDNSSGQLGNGTNTDPTAPVIVPLTGVSAVVAGGDHSLFLKTDGTVWATGWNSSGQLGNGTNQSRNMPVAILSGVKAMAASDRHTLFLETTGKVWATGHNEFGKLGDATTMNRNTPVEIMTGVQAISAGPNRSLFLKTDDSILAAGYVDSQTVSTPVTIRLTPDSGLDWRQEYFGGDAGNPEIAGWTADPDHDGVVNVMERAFNLSPRQSAVPVLPSPTGLSGLPFVQLTQDPLAGNRLELQYVRLRASSNSGLVYSPEMSSAPDNLDGWTAFIGTESIEPINHLWQRVIVKQALPSSIVARFVRVRVTAVVP